MKNKAALTFALLLVANFTFAQKPIYTKAKVNNVNVYLNSAELQNTTTFTVPEGMSEVVVGNISDKIDERSLQIGLSNADVTILSSQFTNNYSSDFKMDLTNPQIKKVSDSIKIVENLLVKSNIDLEANTKGIELLDKNQTVLVGSTSSNVEQLTKLADFYTNKRAELANKIVAINKNNEDLQKQLTRLRNSLKTSEESNAEEFASGVLVLKVKSNTKETLKLNLNYLAYGVSWEPYYEIKGNKIAEPLELMFKAIVRQNTGLDWKNVKLSLINGTSSRNNTAPTVMPWFLYSHNPSQITERSKKEASMEVATFSNFVADDANAPPPPPASAGFSINSNQLNVSYDVDIPYDVRSNGEEHLISLYQQSIPAEYLYFTAPNYNNEAFLLAKIKNFSKYGLVSAPASIVFENMYIGKTFLNTSETEDELDITLGNDRRISIKRENVKDKSGEKFLSSYREKTVTYDLVIRNNKKESIDIEIKDRIPLSNDEKIEVELLDASGAKKDSEKGFLTWTTKMSPAETKTYRVSYKVKYPKDYTISNL
ncbi:MAG: DUF4139 domain-containing protein [Bacteroidales bacterium]